ncbi:hypothetical protein FRC04_010755 [Tulasnella sp. 424]|nr:hypothetical protein FRC04_010755 [Tulasnella sp. 424]KAG8969280.1 hypothetical protein FRC05_001140 [Tulasnella sp. 425]
MEDGQKTTILTIPPEVTVNILEHLLADHTPSKSPYADLLPVTQTSTHLRHTALSAPALWSKIEINDKPASFNFAKLCLSRSGNHKLDISIRVLKKMEAKIKGLLALLQYVSTRIRSLSMKLSFTGVGQWEVWWDSLEALDYRALETLNFEVWHREVVTADTIAVNAIPLPTQNSPLRSLSLVHASLQLPDSPVLSNLAILKLSSASFWDWPYFDLFEVLRNSTALEELELRGVGLKECRRSYSASQLPAVPRLEHPNLRRLSLIAVENNMLARVLTSLTAPNLEVVSLEIPEELQNDVELVWDDLPQAAPFSTVRSLFVTDRSSQPSESPHKDQYVHFLAKMFPGVEELELPAARWRGVFMTRAEHVKIAITPWKDLRSLVLNYPDGLCVGWCLEFLSETLRFLEARKRQDSPPLEWLHLGACSNCPSEVKDLLSSKIQKLMRSKDDLQVIEVSH